MSLGTNLRRARRARHMSHRALAAAAGVTTSTIHGIEQQGQEARFSTIRKIAGALCITPAELVGTVPAKLAPSQPPALVPITAAAQCIEILQALDARGVGAALAHIRVALPGDEPGLRSLPQLDVSDELPAPIDADFELDDELDESESHDPDRAPGAPWAEE